MISLIILLACIIDAALLDFLIISNFMLMHHFYPHIYIYLVEISDLVSTTHIVPITREGRASFVEFSDDFDISFISMLIMYSVMKF